MIQHETGRGLKIFCRDVEVALRNHKKENKKENNFINSGIEKLQNAGVWASWGLCWTRTLTAASEEHPVQCQASSSSAWMVCSGAASKRPCCATALALGGYLCACLRDGLVLGQHLLLNKELLNLNGGKPDVIV